MNAKAGQRIDVLPSLLVIGGGGHGRTVADAAQLSGQFAQIVTVDPVAYARWTFSSCPCIRDESEIDVSASEWLFVAAVGDSALRKRLFEKYCNKGFTPTSVCHPAASISSSALVGRSCVILAASIVGVECRLADGVIINNGAVVEHDCNIGEFVHVASGAVVAGGATIGAASFLGANCSIRHGVSVAAGVTIGHGSVVAGPIASPGTYVGNPAKRLDT